MNQPTPVLLVVAILTECVGICVAGSPTEPQGPPPSQYALSDVILELSEGDRTIRVFGTGAGTVVHHSSMSGDSSSPFSVLSREVFQVLQLCYRGGFFDLQPYYGPPTEVRLRSDGTVETLTTVAADVPGIAVTVYIGRYHKTVSYLKGLALPPPILEEVDRRIRELSSIGTRSDVRGGRSPNFAYRWAAEGNAVRLTIQIRGDDEDQRSNREQPWPASRRPDDERSGTFDSDRAEVHGIRLQCEWW